jgi:hypothetical protein
MVGLERLLYLCHTNGGGVSIAVIGSDTVLKTVTRTLPEGVAALNALLSAVKTPHFRKDTEERLRDVCSFLNFTADLSSSGNLGLSEAIVSRHTDVQHGKFDRGRRKMPWIQWQDGSLTLTMTRADGSYAKITKPEEILPHPYRLAAADAWIKAADRA